MLPTNLNIFIPQSTNTHSDNACGTGIVSSLILSQSPKTRILGADLAPNVLAVYAEKMAAHGWSENTATKVLDVRNLEELDDGTFSHVITNFGFSPDVSDLEGPGKAAREMWYVFFAFLGVLLWSGMCFQRDRLLVPKTYMMSLY